MADLTTFAPVRRSAFAGLALPGRLGQSEGAAGVTVTERTGLALATLIAGRERASDLSAAMEAAFGLALPNTQRVSSREGLSFVWAGPGQWLAVADPDRVALLGAGSPAYPGAALFGALSAAAQGHGAVIDHTDSRGVLRLSGPKVRDTLAKGIGIDLHPRSFGPGSAALTRCALIDMHLWQVDDEPTIDIAVARGFAGSLWDWLAASAGEFGLAVV